MSRTRDFTREWYETTMRWFYTLTDHWWYYLTCAAVSAGMALFWTTAPVWTRLFLGGVAAVCVFALAEWYVRHHRRPAPRRRREDDS